MPPEIRILIVDDEPLARAKLRGLLTGEPGVRVIAECGDGHDAVAAIVDHDPDLVLLDMEMPGLSGLEVISAVGVNRMPVVIIVTGHVGLAGPALDANAADYLLKPVDGERFATAIARARAALAVRASSGAFRPREHPAPGPAGAAGILGMQADEPQGLPLEVR